MVSDDNQPVAPHGPPANRAELEQALTRAGATPAGPAWSAALNGYLTWNPTCSLGLAAYAHALEADGQADEALPLWNSAIEAEPDLPLPELKCLRPTPAAPVASSAPKEEDPERKDKIASLITAVVIHLILIVVFSLWAIAKVKGPPPQILARAMPESETDQSDNERLKREVSPPPSLAASQLDLVSSVSTSEVSIPEISMEIMNPNPVSTGAAFAPSMNFGGGTGDVTFFGSKAKAKKVVYVVDVSGSMNAKGEMGKSKFDLMKEELKRSVSALPFGTEFQIIFFGGPAWFAGTEPELINWNQSGYSWKYKNGNDANLPTKSLIRSTKSRVKATLQHIDEVQTVGSTDWRSPLKMAINLAPDVIYFMTDGAVEETPGKTPLVEDITEYNRERSRSQINSICLMELEAFKMMKELSDKNKGTIFLVQENGEILRGMQLNLID